MKRGLIFDLAHRRKNKAKRTEENLGKKLITKKQSEIPTETLVSCCCIDVDLF